MGVARQRRQLGQAGDAPGAGARVRPRRPAGHHVRARRLPHRGHGLARRLGRAHRRRRPREGSGSGPRRAGRPHAHRLRPVGEHQVVAHRRHLRRESRRRPGRRASSRAVDRCGRSSRSTARPARSPPRAPPSRSPSRARRAWSGARSSARPARTRRRRSRRRRWRATRSCAPPTRRTPRASRRWARRCATSRSPGRTSWRARRTTAGSRTRACSGHEDVVQMPGGLDALRRG